MARRPLTDTPIDQKTKQEAHKKAQQTLKHYLKTRQFLAAFVVAFSILEDRLGALDVVYRRDIAADGSHPSPKPRGFAQMVTLLNEKGYISDSLRKRLFKVNGLRIDVFHASMYNITAVKRLQVERVIRVTRLIASRLEREKRLIKKSKLRDSESQ